MKKNQRGSVELIASLLVFVVVVAIAMVLSSMKCDSRWKLSSLRSDWAPIQGCLVEVRPGIWVPDERVREMDVTPNPTVDAAGQKQ